MGGGGFHYAPIVSRFVRNRTGPFPFIPHQTDNREERGGTTLRFNGNNKLLSQAISWASDSYRSAGVRRAI